MFLVYQRQTVIAGYDANRDGNFLPRSPLPLCVLLPENRLIAGNNHTIARQIDSGSHFNKTTFVLCDE
jgi:hypothetical protein